MGTRAKQIDVILAGLMDSNGNPIAGGSVEFYEAGTSTPKNVWTEKEKTNPFTSITLGADGSLQVYGDGIYKLIVKNADGDTLYTWDDVKIQATTFTVQTKTGVYTTTVDDDVILVNTSGGAVTITLHAASTWEHPLTIKNIGTGGNDVTVDPNASETINNNATATLSDGSTTTLFSDGSNLYSEQTHAASHERGGDDQIDGDHLDIDWNPSNYTPATTPSEADNVDDLAAHLYGIDIALAARTVFTSGTIMLFGHDGTSLKIPTGWTRKTDWQDNAMICYSASDATPGSGGAVNPQSAHAHGMNSHTHNMGAHTHTVSHGHPAGTLYMSGTNTSQGVLVDNVMSNQGGGGNLRTGQTSGGGSSVMYLNNAMSGSVATQNPTSSGPNDDESDGPNTANTENNTAPYYQEMAAAEKD